MAYSLTSFAENKICPISANPWINIWTINEMEETEMRIDQCEKDVCKLHTTSNTGARYPEESDGTFNIKTGKGPEFKMKLNYKSQTAKVQYGQREEEDPDDWWVFKPFCKRNSKIYDPGFPCKNLNKLEDIEYCLSERDAPVLKEIYSVAAKRNKPELIEKAKHNSSSVTKALYDFYSEGDPLNPSDEFPKGEERPKLENSRWVDDGFHGGNIQATYQYLTIEECKDKICNFRLTSVTDSVGVSEPPEKVELAKGKIKIQSDDKFTVEECTPVSDEDSFCKKTNCIFERTKKVKDKWTSYPFVSECLEDGFVPSPYAKPSFECVKYMQLSTTEREICESSMIANLDVKLSKMWKQLSEKDKKLISPTAKWIKQRDKCVTGKFGYYHDCLMDSYRTRMNEIYRLRN